MFRYYCLLVFVKLTSASFPIAVFSFDNLSRRCFNPMLIAKNESNLITSEEFYNFVFELSIANDIPDPKFQVDRNVDLPLELLIEYNKLVCQHHNNSNQCMPGIDVSDVTNISNLTPEEKDDLVNICKKVVVSMKKVLGPSDAPSLAPSYHPSKKPSRVPSVIPTQHPSTLPSQLPSNNPSVDPSQVPSYLPSSHPSNSPSESPNVGPSSTPTVDPTFTPTQKPSNSPNDTPSVRPTNVPTLLSDAPSQRPSVSPTEPPSQRPSIVISNSPSTLPSIKRSVVAIPFGIMNRYNLSAQNFVNNVGGNMDIVQTVFAQFAEEVEEALFTQVIGGSRRMRSLAKRNLSIDFQNTWVTDIADVDCPADVEREYKNQSPPPKCLHMEGMITFVSSSEANPDITEGIIERRSEERIKDGKLMEKVPEELRDTIIFYSLSPDGKAIPVAAITGIAIGAAIVGLIAGRLFVSKKRRKKDMNNPYDGLDGAVDSSELTDHNSSPREKSSPSSYRGLAEEALYRQNMNEISLESSAASSSNAGSSGWSSSAGISSLNTASVDSAEYFGSSLAAIGAASNFTRRYNKSPGSGDDAYRMVEDIEESSLGESELESSIMESEDEFNLSPVRKQRQLAVREELDGAIQTGNWSLVGATAAIIAQLPADYMSSDRSSFSSILSSSIATNTRDSERAAELDRLVDCGDWEGVVLAAAKFEAESDRDGVTEGSASISEGQQFLAARNLAIQSDANSTTSPSVSTNISESASNNLKRAETRSEVEALVRRVVPDEIDNIDEMMHQFQGREEELVETLRTMQERSIAARQREAMRRNAKREARNRAKKNKPPLGRRPVGQTAPQDRSAMNDMNNSSFYTAASGVETETENENNTSKMSEQSNESTNNSNSLPSREALDYAIQIGDWEAVGRTAEQLGEGSISETTSEYHSADERSFVTSKSTPSVNDADRAFELESLIDKGDWSGVVAAASRYTAADNDTTTEKKKEQGAKASGENSDLLQTSMTSTNHSQFDDARSQSTEAKKEKNLKEEEDALAQAEIWMTIAAQSKNDNSNATKGASEAADWAISQSLKQIQATTTNEKQETQSIASSCDDKSV